MHAQFADTRVDMRHVLLDPPDDAEVVASTIIEAANKGTLEYRSA